MQFFSKAICGTLIASFNFSICTGGILSTASTFAADFAGETVADGLQGQFLPEIPLCQSATPHVHTNITVNDSAEPLDCANGEECFQSASRTNLERAFGFIAQIDHLVYKTIQDRVRTINPDFSWSTIHYAREGPLFDQAALFAHVLVKLE